MKICFIAEGSYPYVVGGVSSWIDMIIRKMPEHEFVIQTIAVGREDSGKFKYNLPENVTQVNESFLLDNDIVSRNAKPLSLTSNQADAFKSFVFGDDINWDSLFNFFIKHQVSVNDLVMGPDFLEIISQFCNERYDRVVFSNFLWTYRSMMLPLCILLKTKIPEADIYHSVSTGYAGILGCMAKFQYGKPFLLSEHGIYTREREEDIIRSEWTKGLYKDIWIEHFYKLSKCAYKNADLVTSLFEAARTLQIDIGCPTNKTTVIANGIDIKSFEGIAQKDPEDPFINIGIIARVTPIKDIKTLLNSFSYAKAAVPNLKLYIMGPVDEDAIYYQECLDLIEGLNLKDVEFTGRVNIKDYVGKMDIGILTSISEGQPLSLLEFMAAGKAVIATRVGSCEEIINGPGEEPEECGIVTPVINVGKISEAMIQLARDQELRNHYGEIGKKRVRDIYDDRDLLRKYNSIYEKLNFENGGAY